mmetsp:Transcript_17014/g.54449  ORF Transcript_17014/g.54449 Transcript_17014/m.54449 type:complete len:250 (+) Transcript_17014:158-907(+)
MANGPKYTSSLVLAGLSSDGLRGGLGARGAGLLAENVVVAHVLFLVWEDRVQDHGDDDADAVRGLEQHHDGGAEALAAGLVLCAAVTVVVDARGHLDRLAEHRCRVVAARDEAVRFGQFDGAARKAARGGHQDGCHGGEAGADVRLGPQAKVVPQVLRVEGARRLEELRLHGDPEPEGDREHNYVRVAPVEGRRDDGHTRDKNHREALEDHAADDRDGDGGEGGADLPKDAEEDEPDRAREAGRAGGAL